MKSGLAIRGIRHRYANDDVLSGTDLHCAKGAITVLVGPSGCGKSTLLRLICGLERTVAGSIHLDGRQLSSESTFIVPERRGVGLVFQDGALFNHLTVAQNVGFGLPSRDRRKSPRIDEMLELTSMSAMRDRYPAELSGGQQQRVAIARALAPGPSALLLDEPFANLDAISRRTLRHDLAELLRSTDTTTLLVTHDRDEAWVLADELALMNNGKIVQAGPPNQVYQHPSTKWAAEFLGDLESVQIEHPHWPPSGDAPQATNATNATSQDPSDIAWVRPENVRIARHDNGIGLIQRIEFAGPTSTITIASQIDPTDTIRSISIADSGLAVGDRVNVEINARNLLRFDNSANRPTRH